MLLYLGGILRFLDFPALKIIQINLNFFLKEFLYFYYLFIYLFILFLSVLGLRFCARAFSSCGKRGPLFIAVRGASRYRGLSCCGAQAPDVQAQ